VLAARRIRSDSDRLVLTGLAVAAFAFAAQTTGQLVDYWTFHLRIAELNGNSASSAFSWVSAAAILGIGASFALVAVVAPAQRRRAAALAALFAFLLVDNRAHIHERLAHGKLLFLPILGAAFALLWQTSRNLPPRHRALIRGGLGFLFVSLVVHIAGPTVLSWAGWGVHDWQYQVKVAIKESTEKAGWILVCFGALAVLRSAWGSR
jgi:hypothetical protein